MAVTMVAQVGGGVDVTQPPGVVTVGVKMLMLVGVHQIAVGVLVGVNMAVSVDVRSTAVSRLSSTTAAAITASAR